CVCGRLGRNLAKPCEHRACDECLSPICKTCAASLTAPNAECSSHVLPVCPWRDCANNGRILAVEAKGLQGAADF
ncbi:hypothetical protein BD626DRAFT_361748, partial [Schizophyllum amplum]